MADKTLTQFEVDALLAAFGPDGRADEDEPRAGRSRSSRPVKAYDFRRPDKFSKEQLRSLQLLYENFARLLGTGLTSLLRGTVSLHLTSVEQITYAEYIEQLPKPAALYLLGLDPLPGRAVLELNLPISFAIIDRLLGGPGDIVNPRQGRQNSEMSEIEVALLRSLSDILATTMQDAWADIAALAPRVDDIAFSPELVQAALPNEVCVLILLELKVLNNAGTLSLCMPYTLLEPIVGRLSAQTLVAGSYRGTRKEDPRAQQRKMRQLERVTLPVSVQLGTAAVTVNDMLTLEPGDVICLDTPASGTLPMLIDGRPRYRVRPGANGARLAVRVERVLPPEPTDLDLAARTAAEAAHAHDHKEGIEGSHEQRIAV
jgi:flagellar motor switch protein FliM